MMSSEEHKYFAWPMPCNVVYGLNSLGEIVIGTPNSNVLMGTLLNPAGDGNCLFNALLMCNYEYNGSVEQLLRLKYELTEYLRSHSNEKLCQCEMTVRQIAEKELKQDEAEKDSKQDKVCWDRMDMVEVYLKRTLPLGRQGCYLEILAFAELRQLNVVIYYQQTRTNVSSAQAVMGNDTKTIALWYDGSHYQSILPIRNEYQIALHLNESYKVEQRRLRIQLAKQKQGRKIGNQQQSHHQQQRQQQLNMQSDIMKELARKDREMKSEEARIYTRNRRYEQKSMLKRARASDMDGTDQQAKCSKPSTPSQHLMEDDDDDGQMSVASTNDRQGDSFSLARALQYVGRMEAEQEMRAAQAATVRYGEGADEEEASGLDTDVEEVVHNKRRNPFIDDEAGESRMSMSDVSIGREGGEGEEDDEQEIGDTEGSGLHEEANTSNKEEEAEGGGDASTVVDTSHEEANNPEVVDMSHEEANTPDATLTKDDECDNCHRRNFALEGSVYHMNMKIVLSNRIRNVQSPLKTIVSIDSTDELASRYKLCPECARYLEETDEVKTMKTSEKTKLSDWKNTWPSFYWNLLSGKDCITDELFYSVYSDLLWQYIPTTIRNYWYNAEWTIADGHGQSDINDSPLMQLYVVQRGMKSIMYYDANGRKGRKPPKRYRPYVNCTTTHPPSFFVDRTTELQNFVQAIDSYELKQLLRLLRAEEKNGYAMPVILPVVLCPWGENEFAFRAEHCNPALIIQHQLRKVALNMPRGTFFDELYTIESSRQDYIRENVDEYDYLLLNEQWVVRPSVQMVPNKGLVILVCRHHKSDTTRKRLYCHPPRKPNRNNLSAESSDQLSPCVVMPRTCRLQRAGTYNAGCTVTAQQTSFSGIDSMNLMSEGKFTKASVMLGQHEALSLACRPDIQMLLNRYVTEGIVTAKFADYLRQKASELFPPELLQKYKDGATYVSIEDSMQLQLYGSRDNSIEAVVRRKDEHKHLVDTIVRFKPSWAPLINIMQMEDSKGFGYTFQPIKTYGRPTKQGPVMMMWALASAIMGCKELWYSITQRRGPFRYDGWEGHMLGHLQVNYMRHEHIQSPRSTPFLPSKDKSLLSMLEWLRLFMTPDIEENFGKDQNCPTLFYGFDVEYWKRLFPPGDFPDIAVRESACGITWHSAESGSPPTVVIVVGKDKPIQAVERLVVEGTTYEARVIMCLSENPLTRHAKPTPSAFDAVRYVRWGLGHDKWWKQERRRLPFMLQCRDDKDAFQSIANDKSANYFMYVTLYVKVKKLPEEQYKLDFLKSIGGQSHVYCSCNSFPLLVTYRSRNERRKCMRHGCNDEEHFICSNYTCRTRLCRKHFEVLSLNEVTTLDPPASPTDMDVDVGGSANDGHSQHAANNDQCFEENHSSLREQIRSHQKKKDDASVELVDDDASVEFVGEEQSDGDFFLTDYLTCAYSNPVETAEDNLDEEDEDEEEAIVPMCTNAGDFAYNVLPRQPRRSVVPCHVLLNQVGSLCTRYNKRIQGSLAQLNFVQKLVSTMTGNSWPLLYPMAALFPRHFYSSATRDPCAILGALPLSCYINVTNPHGMASTLSTIRNLLTHSSSSSSTCSNLVAFSYDMQSNRIASGVDSRLIRRSGFVVDEMSPLGMSLRNPKQSPLNQSVDSHQEALNLSAVQREHKFDWFVTITCNQAKFPGICHLYNHKESMAWTKHIGGYASMSSVQRKEVKRSFDQAYGGVLLRCWMEVRYIWLSYITYSTSSITGAVEHAFWRDEYQEDVGNLPHIHGLFGLKQKDMRNEDVRKIIYDLQQCSVADLFPTKNIPKYLEEELFQSQQDWYKLTNLGRQILTHTRHTERCLERIGEGEGPENFKCRVPDPVRDSIRPLENDLIPFHFKFSPTCLDILEDCKLYEKPSAENPHGTFHNNLFRPMRHRGRVNPAARCRMSPVIPEWFAFTQSMMNTQVLTETNGVARYVLKYVTELDEANRTTLWADPHSGAAFLTENQFLHNTKIGKSKWNEQLAFDMSRRKGHPTGRKIITHQMSQQLLGYPEVMSTYNFENIQTNPLELRSTTKLKLDNNGKLIGTDIVYPQNKFTNPDDANEDVSFSIPVPQLVRRQKVPSRLLTSNQLLSYRCSGAVATDYDSVTLFGHRAVELLEVIPRLYEYYRFCVMDPEPMSIDELEEHLSEDVTTCYWVDSLCRRIRFRYRALEEVLKFLENEVDTSEFPLQHDYSKKLREYLMTMIRSKTYDDTFVAEDDGKSLPIPVFSSITPHDSLAFVLHVMLTLGRYETELDFHMAGTLRESLVLAKLIGDRTDTASLQAYSIQLTNKVIDGLLPYQPAPMLAIQDYVVSMKSLFDSVLLEDAIPSYDLPPCIMSELLDDKDTELLAFAAKKRSDHLDSIYATLRYETNLPPRGMVEAATKSNPLGWSPLTPFNRFPHQSYASFEEQRLSVRLGVQLIDKYRRQLGPSSLTLTKNYLIHGVPGSGKTYVIQMLTLYAMSKGLNVMTTALLGARAIMLGGVHIHKLFGLSTKKSIHSYRAAELSMEKLERKSQMKFLSALRKVDVLIIDEAGQLAAEVVNTVDIVLKKVRQSRRPFGGVLVMVTMDPYQIGPIEGLPFLVSTHILTNFILVQLMHSVRAHRDTKFQEIQNITRMSPGKLKNSEAIKRRFTKLMSECITFVDSFDDPKITPDTQRMYSKKMPAFVASNEYIAACQKQFESDNTPFFICHSEDYQHRIGSRADFVPATSKVLIDAMNKALKEPPRLLFRKGAMFEATFNGDGYYQSQLLIMLQLPTREVLRNKSPLELLVAPAYGIHYLDMSNGIPSERYLLSQQWKKVKIPIAPKREVSSTGVLGFRRQYGMKSVGASTINKQIGNTLMRCAIEYHPPNCPWEKAQIVVMLSRTHRACDTIIVGPKQAAIEHMYQLLCVGSQWTEYIETILRKLTVNADQTEDDTDSSSAIDYPTIFPYRTCDIPLPRDNSGFVYLLISIRDFNRTYVGETINIVRRLQNHNSGYGARGTTDPIYRPYFVAGYICGLGDFTKKERQALERRWQQYNLWMLSVGRTDVQTRINQGQRVVDDYNLNKPKELHITFIKTVNNNVVGG